MKKFLLFLMCGVLLMSLTACMSVPSTTDDNTPANTTTTTQEQKLSFELVAGELGEYGSMITLNKGNSAANTRCVYHIPAGTYKVTNIGRYMDQIGVYSDETHITEEGWEEPAESFYVKLLDVNASDTFSIQEGQYVYIAEPGRFKFELQ